MKPCSSPDSVPERFRLPEERQSLTHKFRIAEFKGCLTIGFYPDGRIGEIFIEAEKQGSTIRGMLGSFAKAISIGLQYGIPLEHFAHSFKYMRFTPEGYTDNKDIHNATSVTDYIFKYLERKLENGYLREMRPPLASVDTSEFGYPETGQSDSSTSQQMAISCKSK